MAALAGFTRVHAHQTGILRSMNFRRIPSALPQLALLASLGFSAPAALAQASPPQEPPQLSNAEFQSCLSELRTSKAFAAITPATFTQYTEHLQPDATVLPLLNLEQHKRNKRHGDHHDHRLYQSAQYECKHS